MAKRFWKRAFDLIVLIPAILIFVSPGFARANYAVGIVGVGSRVNNVNLGEYTDVTETENPLLYAQNVFTEIMTTDLPQIGAEFVGVDKTERTTSRRMDEVMFQLQMGNPANAIKLFDRKLDYLIYGYITNLTITHRESFVSSNLSVDVSLSVRIVDASTGKIVCVATGRGESASHGEGGRKSFKFGGDEISEECWHEALEKALKKVMTNIKKQV